MFKINKAGEKLEWKDISPGRIISFLKDKWSIFWGVRIKHKDLVAVSEIITYRTTLCQECVDDGACLKSKGGCGCTFPNMAFDMSKTCGKEQSGAARWFPIDKNNITEDWNNFKKENNLVVDIKRF